MKLYYSPGACSLSPHIVALEAGLKLDLIKVDLRTKRTADGDDFKQLNPNGYVPLLVLDDGKTLSEGPAIVQYLADLAPAKNLIPAAGTFERYHLQQWLNFISTEIHKGFGLLFNPAAPEAAKQFAVSHLGNRFDTLSERLSAQPYLLGEHFTVADAYLFVTLSWGQYVNVDITHWPALADYVQLISERTAVQLAMQEEGLIK
ncbi:MAG: glutathione transferase GstA [Methylococcales bacterium]|nr:glutathione transferase GstA [Methylococcales bacterium]